MAVCGIHVKALPLQLNMFRDCYSSQVNMATTGIVAFTHLSKRPAKSEISIWSLSSESKKTMLSHWSWITSCCMLLRLQEPVTWIKNSKLARLVACIKKNMATISSPNIYTADALQCSPLHVSNTLLCFVEPEIWKFETSCREIDEELVMTALLLSPHISCRRVACLYWHRKHTIRSKKLVLSGTPKWFP